MAEPDIRIVVGNTGDASPSGESAKLIRNNLQAALSESPVKAKIVVDTTGSGTSASSIQSIAQATAKLTTARLADATAAQRQSTAQAQNIKAAKQAASAMLSTAQATAKASSMQASFNKYLTTVNPKALTQFSSEINNINSTLSQGTPEACKLASAQITGLKAAIETAGYSGGNAVTFLVSKLKSFGVYLASSAITMGAVSGVRTMIENVKDLDAALTDLRIVTGATREETEELLSTYNKMAQQLGTTTTSVASGAVDWLRQGYSEGDARELLKQSMTLSIVGDMDSVSATDALTAALKGYQLQVSEASDVVDKFFTVDMAAATSSEDMALALAKTAANAKLAGLSLDDVIGQLARVNEVMKEDGSSTGTFYNTMLSRIGALKSGRLSDPETDENLSDVEATLRGLGIELRTSESEFRNFGEVLDEVAGKWDSFSSVSQRAIATAFAGKMCA